MLKLFIGNIPHASADDDLREWVESQGFPVKASEIIRDRSTGQSRGFGFVTLNEDWKIKDAIAALNGQRMGGRVLTVNEATPLPPRGSRESSHDRGSSYKQNDSGQPGSGMKRAS